MLTEYDSQHTPRDHQQYDQRDHRQYDQRDQRDQRHYDQRDPRQYDQRDARQYDHRDPRQYDQGEQQHQQQPRLTGLERGRQIKLMRNGDLFFPGRAFVINQRKYPMLDVFLDDASQALHANFGAVRCIYTPRNGTRLRDISEFEDHQTYVAAGVERFKRLQYHEIAEGRRVHVKDRTPPRLPPVRRFDIEGRALKLSRSENMIIYVYRNGDPLSTPAKILLVKATLQNWESVLDEVTKKVSLTSSAVLKLYSMNGELVTSGHQLEYNGSYVAAGKERFKRIDYPDPKSISPNSSPKMSRKSDYPRIKLPVRQKGLDDFANRQAPSDTQQSTAHRYTKSDGTNTHTANSHGSNEHPGHRRPVREENDFFNSKPHPLRRGPTQETDLDRDDGGIYKGRLNHRERVREVNETRDTKVDLPVDHREVETVEEEHFHGNADKKSHRNQQPPPQTKTHQAVANSRRRSPPPQSVNTPPKSYHNGNHADEDDEHENDHANNQKFAMNNGHHQRSNSQHRTNGNGFDERNHRQTPPPARHVEDEINDDRDEEPISRSHHHHQQHAPSHAQVNQEDEHHAATVIQSHVRGYLTRKQTYHEKPHNTDQLPNNQHQQGHTKHLTDDHDEQKDTNQSTKHHHHQQQETGEHDGHHHDRPPSQLEDSTLESLAKLTVQRALKEALSTNEKEKEKRRYHHDDDDDNV